MKFSKMHGAGNDYVYIDCINQYLPEEERPALARKVSVRSLGVGSDGLICICSSEKADFKMDMYNLDGSQGKMCGNGIRCVGKYAYDKGLTKKKELTIETLAGIKKLSLNIGPDGLVQSVRVNMGSPSFKTKDLPMISDTKEFMQKPISVGGQEYLVTAVSVGNPHIVTFVDDVDALDLEKIGPLFENHELFPEGVNTEFIQIIDRNHLKMRVWERGSGETLACGTGSTASLAATVMAGKCEDSARISLRGGELHIHWNRDENEIYMTGPAVLVFDGDLRI